MFWYIIYCAKTIKPCISMIMFKNLFIIVFGYKANSVRLRANNL